MVIESHDASVDIIGSEPEKWHPQQRETADHSFHVLKSSGKTDAQVMDEIGAETATWVGGLKG